MKKVKFRRKVKLIPNPVNYLLTPCRHFTVNKINKYLKNTQ